MPSLGTTFTLFRALPRGLCPQNFFSVPCRPWLLEKLDFNGLLLRIPQKNHVSSLAAGQTSHVRLLLILTSASEKAGPSGSTTPRPRPRPRPGPDTPLKKNPAPPNSSATENNQKSALLCQMSATQHGNIEIIEWCFTALCLGTH